MSGKSTRPPATATPGQSAFKEGSPGRGPLGRGGPARGSPDGRASRPGSRLTRWREAPRWQSGRLRHHLPPGPSDVPRHRSETTDTKAFRRRRRSSVTQLSPFPPTFQRRPVTFLFFFNFQTRTITLKATPRKGSTGPLPEAEGTRAKQRRLPAPPARGDASTRPGPGAADSPPRPPCWSPRLAGAGTGESCN